MGGNFFICYKNYLVHTNLYKSYLLEPVTRLYHLVGFGLIALADISLYPISFICFVLQFTFADV